LCLACGHFFFWAGVCIHNESGKNDVFAEPGRFLQRAGVPLPFLFLIHNVLASRDLIVF